MMGIDTVMAQSMLFTPDQMVGSLRQQKPNIDPRIVEIVIEVAEEEAAVMIDQMLPMMMERMAGYYTVDEFKEIIAFYKTPTSKKSLQVMPQMTGDLQQILGAVIPASQQRIGQKIQDRLRAAGFQ